MIIPIIDPVATGKMMKSIRKSKNVKVIDIATICGISRNAVSRWERGDCMPTIDNLVILASVLGVTLEELLVIDKNDIPEKYLNLK